MDMDKVGAILEEARLKLLAEGMGINGVLLVVAGPSKNQQGHMDLCYRSAGSTGLLLQVMEVVGQDLSGSNVEVAPEDLAVGRVLN